MFIYLIFISLVTVRVRIRVRVSYRVRVRFNDSHLSRKCCTVELIGNATYLARHRQFTFV